MLTRTAALTTGRIICASLAREQQDERMQGPDNQPRYHARGVAIRALIDIYMSMNHKARMTFQCNTDAFLKACGWPD